MTDHSKPYDGGPAFPNPALANESFQPYCDMSGMTKREWFAGQALPAVYESCVETRSSKEGETWCQMVARESYEMADAMIADRT